MSELNVFHATPGQGWTEVDLSAPSVLPDTPVAPMVVPEPVPDVAPAVPEEAVPPVEEPAPAPAADATAPLPVAEPPPLPSRGERRAQQLEEQIEQRLAARRAAQQELERTEATLAARRAELAALSGMHPTAASAATASSAPSGAPQRAQYAEESAYLTAVAAWSGEQAAERALARQKAEEHAQRILDRHATGERTYANYREVITNPELDPPDFLQPVLADFVSESAAAPHVLYKLGTDTEAFAEFVDLNPRGAKRYLARLAAEWEAQQAPQTPTPAPRATVSPTQPLPSPVAPTVPPVRPLSGGGSGPVGVSAATIAEQRGSFADYVRARNAEEARR